MALAGYGANTSQYDQQSSDLQYRYNTDRASNAYGRFLSQQRGTRTLGDLSQNFNRALPSYKAKFGQRGLAGPGVQSGAMQHSMRNYLGDYAQQYGRAQLDAQQEAAQFDQSGAQLDAYYNNSLAQIAAAKQAEIANSASAIESLRQLLGGL
jgi:hypothetical protein